MKFDEMINYLRQEILKIKTASLKSAVTMATEQTEVSLSTPTSASTGYGYAFITLVANEPFICQAYFDDVANFQADHRSWVLAVFFPYEGVASLVVQVVDPSKTGKTFADDVTVVATSDVTITVSYGG